MLRGRYLHVRADDHADYWFMLGSGISEIRKDGVGETLIFAFVGDCITRSGQWPGLCSGKTQAFPRSPPLPHICRRERS